MHAVRRNPYARRAFYFAALLPWFYPPALSAADKPAGGGEAKAAARRFLKGLQAKDVEELVRAADAPWLGRDRRILSDWAEVRKQLAELLKHPDPAWAALEVGKAVLYAEHRKDLPDEPGRKLLDQVLGKDGWLVPLSATESLSMRYVLVRPTAGGPRVVGGPYRITFLLRPNEIPKVARESLEKPEELELISLDPDRRAAEPKPEDDFHGWKVLGRTAPKQKEARARLAAAVLRGAEESEGAAAACFNPRHGLRLTRGGKTVDLVLCFECLQAEVYDGEKRVKGFLTSASPQAEFDAALKDARVPLAEKPKE